MIQRYLKNHLPFVRCPFIYERSETQVGFIERYVCEFNLLNRFTVMYVDNELFDISRVVLYKKSGLKTHTEFFRWR